MDEFKQNILQTYGKSGQIWLDNLANLTCEMAQTWGLSKLKPISNLTFNYILSGFQKEKAVILKITFEAHRLKNEVEALKIFAGFGAVLILAQTDGAMLLEQIIPGNSLKTYLPHKKNEALQIICTLMKKLHQAPFPLVTTLPQMKDLLTTLDKNWEITIVYLEKARQLKNKLLNETRQELVVLHGDLHHNNILSDGIEWHIIDPHGIIGYPINEVWAFIIEIEKDTQYIADYFNFDVRQVREWYFVHLVLQCCWKTNDMLNPKFFLKLVAKTCQLITN